LNKVSCGFTCDWFELPGDADNRIHFEGYQVSNQCMALVSDDCLIPTRDAPELGYVKESTNEQYVPDVFYKVYVCLSLSCHYFNSSSN
jgi:NPL4 family